MNNFPYIVICIGSTSTRNHRETTSLRNETQQDISRETNPIV